MNFEWQQILRSFTGMFDTTENGTTESWRFVRCAKAGFTLLEWRIECEVIYTFTWPFHLHIV
jgi:hypothetical protein